MASIYDYPQYYDILFGWERDREADFYHAAFLREGLQPGANLLELCCATGQLGLRLAARGWRVTGLDIRPGMLEYMEGIAVRRGLQVNSLEADMRNFASFLFDGMYCPINSFRLLRQYDDMRAHLRSVGGNLRAGGIYVLDLFFSGAEGETLDMGHWSNRRDGIEVSSRGDHVVVEDPAKGPALRLDWGDPSRRYRFGEFAELIARSGLLEIASCHPVTDSREAAQFHLDRSTSAPAGRTMVILRRLVPELD